MLTEKQLRDLRAAVPSPILDPSHPDFDKARRIWNGMIDRRPSAIVCCTGISDVMRAVQFVRECSVPFTVRGGGHSIPGNSVADGALMIDLSHMKNIQVNMRRQSAVAQAGMTWKEFDAATEKSKLATTGGVISSTGIAGLTLGGGLGWLMGKHGLAADNLISADIVTAEGRHVRASVYENPDLYWAIRGGGGNFGIVTAFEFRLHHLEAVRGGVILYPRNRAIDLLRRYRDIIESAPDELTAYAALMTGHGTPMAAIALCHSGENDAPEATAQFLLSDSPVADLTGRKKYSEIQSMLDFTAPPGLHYYFTCPFLQSLTDEAISAIVEQCDSMPTEQSQVVIEHMHGGQPCAPCRYGLRPASHSVQHQYYAGMGSGGSHRKVHRLGQKVRCDSARVRRVGRLCKLSQRRGRGRCSRILWRKLRSAPVFEGKIRSRKRIPLQSEYWASRAVV